MKIGLSFKQQLSRFLEEKIRLFEPPCLKKSFFREGPFSTSDDLTQCCQVLIICFCNPNIVFNYHVHITKV